MKPLSLNAPKRQLLNALLNGHIEYELTASRTQTFNHCRTSVNISLQWTHSHIVTHASVTKKIGDVKLPVYKDLSQAPTHDKNKLF